MSAKTYGKNTNEIACRQGDAFELKLEALPSAGYEWRVEIDEAKADVHELSAEMASEAFGAGSAQRFRIEPHTSGRTTIRLIYGRPWEADPVETRTVELSIS